MKCPFCISFLMSCAVWFAACTGPVLIDEPVEDSTHTEQSGTTPSDDTSQMQEPVAIIHEGTYTSPYSIGEAQALERGKEVWIEGYIVGCVSGSMKTGCNFSASANTAANILLADTFPTGGENDYLYCLPVELPTGTIERNDLNLYDNPNNYHRKLRIQGDITLYYKVAGIKDIAAYIFCDEITEEDQDQDQDQDENEDEDEGDNNESEPESPDTPHNPDATYTDTLSIAEGIKLQSDSKYNQVYIKGYIVGYTTSNRKIYYDLVDIKKTSARSNVMLADNLEERDPDKMISVELTNGSYIQQAVNLVDNPQNLHRQLTVKGAMKTYKGLNGCIDIPNGYDNDIDYFFLLE